MNGDGNKFLKEIGAKFYSLRVEQNKEIEIVASALKISPGLLQWIEKGDYDLPLELFFELCDYFDIKVYDFVSEVEDRLKVSS